VNREKIPPSERLRKEIEAIKSGTEEIDQNIVGELVKKAKALVLQEMLEQEVEDHLGRGYYQRRDGREKKGYRNGYEPRKIRGAEDVVTVEMPQVRETGEPYRSRLGAFFKGNTDVLEKLAVEMYARGLSTRDIEEALTTATGERLLSRSSISRITDQLWEEYDLFSQQDLSGYEVVYLVIDAVYEAIRPYIETSEALLVAYGITMDGRKVLLHMELGNKESYEFCRGFLRNMRSRGMPVPVAVTSDGAPGLMKAIDEIFPRSLRIRCWVHKMRNLSVKLPQEFWQRIKPEIAAIRDALDYEEGKARLDAVVKKYQRQFPSFTRCLQEDADALLNILYLPYRHRKTVRNTNLIERMFVEERRRTKIIPQFLTEKSCLKLVFGVLHRACRHWRRIPMSEQEREEISQLRTRLGIAEEISKDGASHKEMVHA